MAKRNRFPPEADTQPDMLQPKGPRTSGAAPKGKRHNPTTAPPPKSTRDGKGASRRPKAPDSVRNSGVKSRRPRSSDKHVAVVDEVTADLSKDPRRDKEE
jgi:hypothetical protein